MIGTLLFLRSIIFTTYDFLHQVQDLGEKKRLRETAKTGVILATTT